MQFRDIVGQEKAKASFFKAVHEKRLPHALLLKGAEGIGKLAFATAIAQYVNCDNPSETDSCGVCGNCSKTAKGIHPDVRYALPIILKKEGTRHLLSDDYFGQFRAQFFGNPYYSFREWIAQLEGENKQVTIPIEEIRDLKRKLSLMAFEGVYKVVIFWNAEKINTSASNALLKLLEEPPDRTLIIMTVTDTSQLLNTINSRCQRMQMHRIGDETMHNFLVNKHGLSEGHAIQIAQISEGSMSRALELVNETNDSLANLYQSWLRFCFEGQYHKIQDWVESVAKENREFQKLFLLYAIKKIRDSLLFSFNMEGLALVTEEEKVFHQRFSQFVNANGVDGITRLMDESLFYISRNANSQMVFQVLSLRIHSLLTGKVLI